MFKINIGSKIKKLRNDKNFTQEDLSKKLHISRKTISGWENNRSLPDIYSILKIGEIFDVSSDELLKSKNFSDNKKINSKKRIILSVAYSINLFLCIISYIFLIKSIDSYHTYLHLFMTLNLIIYVFLFPHKIHKNLYFYLIVLVLCIFNFFIFNIFFNHSLISDLPGKDYSYIVGAIYGTFMVNILLTVSLTIIIFMFPSKNK